MIDSFDWSDAAGLRKGFAHPSLRRIAEIRGVEKRTVRRHLAELERARLIAREERPGRPNVLVIEDPSEEETRRYLQNFDGRGEDNTVLPTPDETVRPYKKEEREERQNLVNEEQALLGGEEQSRQPTRMPRAKREYLAGEMLAVLQDDRSLGYYRHVAETIEPHLVFEALSIVKQMSREGKVLKSKGALFVSLLQRKTTRTEVVG